MPPTPIIGITAMAITTMPSPPNHCKMPRHSKMPGGTESRPVMTVEPVVVMPLMASKKASVKLSFNSENMNGRAAKMVSTNQLSDVMTKAWRTFRRTFPVDEVRASDTPTNKVNPAERAKTCQSVLPCEASTMAGMHMLTASVASNIPIIRKMGRKSIMSRGSSRSSKSARESNCPRPSP